MDPFGMTTKTSHIYQISSNLKSPIQNPKSRHPVSSIPDSNASILSAYRDQIIHDLTSIQSHSLVMIKSGFIPKLLYCGRNLSVL